MKQPASSRLKHQLKNMSVDELVGVFRLFRQCALKQDEAMLDRDQTKVNRLASGRPDGYDANSWPVRFGVLAP